MAGKKKIKVAVVVDALRNLGGAEAQLKSIIETYPNADIYTVGSDKEFIKEHFPKSKVINSFVHYMPFEKALRREYYLLHPLAYRLFSFKKYDVVITQTISFAKFVRTRKVKNLFICLTPPKFFWMHGSRGIKEMKRASYYFYKLFIGSFLERIWQRWDRNAARRADKVLSISEVVQKRVKKFYDIESDVLYPPINPDSLKYNDDIGTRENWYLYFGRVETYKGVDLAIKAAVKAGVPLKIAGKGPHIDAMQDLVKELNAKGKVKFLGFVDDETKKDLLYRCQALIFPVQDEDFGIVPVEANASGAPVIAYRSGGVTETISEKNPKSGVFFDEYSADSLAEVLTQFDPDMYKAVNCKKQADNFSDELFKYKLKNFVTDLIS